MPFRLLVTGGRDFTDRILDQILAKHPDVEIWQGGARGADRMAYEWSVANARPERTFPANWKADGPGAGPIRNQRMIDAGPDAVVAFPGGKGTADCVARAREAGLKVWEPKGEPNVRR